MVLQECNATVLGAVGCKRRSSSGWPIGRNRGQEKWRAPGGADPKTNNCVHGKELGNEG